MSAIKTCVRSFDGDNMEIDGEVEDFKRVQGNLTTGEHRYTQKAIPIPPT